MPKSDFNPFLAGVSASAELEVDAEVYTDLFGHPYALKLPAVAAPNIDDGAAVGNLTDVVCNVVHLGLVDDSAVDIGRVIEVVHLGARLIGVRQAESVQGGPPSIGRPP